MNGKLPLFNQCILIIMSTLVIVAGCIMRNREKADYEDHKSWVELFGGNLLVVVGIFFLVTMLTLILKAR